MFNPELTHAQLKPNIDVTPMGRLALPEKLRMRWYSLPALDPVFWLARLWW